MGVQDWRVSRCECGRVVDDDEPCLEFLCDCRRVVCRADHVAALDLLLVYAPEVKADVVACFCVLHLCVVSFNGLDFACCARRHDDHLVVCPHLASLDPAHRHRADASDSVYVLHWNAQRLADRLLWRIQRVKRRSKGRALVPRHVCRRLY